MKFTRSQVEALRALGLRGKLAMSNKTSAEHGSIRFQCAQTLIEAGLAVDDGGIPDASRVYVTLTDAGRKAFLQYVS